MGKKVLFFLMALFAFFLLIPKSALADGMIIIPDPYSNRWNFGEETNQQAYINYDGHLQKMIISIGLDKPDIKEAVWIFPVPANPDKIVIDVLDRLPHFGGEEISRKTEMNLDQTSNFLLSSQLYPIPFLSYGQLQRFDISSSSNTLMVDGGEKSMPTDVVVYEHLEKKGLTTEIVTAKTANGLYLYLTDKELKIESGQVPVLDNYIGKDYSFVVSWIQSIDKIIAKNDIRNRLDMYIFGLFDYPKLEKQLNILRKKFPELEKIYTDYNMHNEMWLPMESDISTKEFDVEKMTEPQPAYDDFESVLYDFLISKEGEAVFDELVKAIQNDPSIITSDYDEYDDPYSAKQRGLLVTFPTKKMYYPLLPTSVYGSKTVPATLRVIGHIQPKIFKDIEAYTKTKYYLGKSSDTNGFYNSSEKKNKYTKIKISAPSKYLSDDLWIENKTPIKTKLISFLASNPLAIGIGMFLFNSVLASVVVGIILFKNLRKHIVKLGLLGLTNCFSIFGLAITTLFLNTKASYNEEANRIIDELRQKGYVRKRKIAIFALFPSFALSLVFFVLLFLNMLFGFGYGLIDIYFWNGSLSSLLSFVPWIFLLILMAVLFFVLKEVRTEDKKLFHNLKKLGYSTWLFQPKDLRKIIFVPLFSLLFVVLTLWGAKLIKFLL